ncbi:GNAT family N-acetyltransferase [Phytomonospora endophytica]|uniref:GNAT superfamily N-acetyltransferase n=1 Tax=Phytomonospora endophytica TaxID=714109 RepID=A0A841G2E4_9ACTN|nr:GNAT family N-acetyltransferase [Phytomonospora endophytica]MBB6039942.1 GNAT superfamily N-acetyltransferase [Phytomonospora endophytica]GIG70987.1 N-acetyltransferase [Phytomonospora endophytica]
MPITVRRLTTADLDVARTLRLTALKDAPTAFLSTYEGTVTRTDEEWRSWIEAVTVFAAFVDGKPAGMVGAVRDELEADVTELISMWVAPEARGARLAQRLTDAVVEHARSVGDRAVHLEVVWGNDAAEAAYLRYGFAHIPARKAGQRDRSMWLGL